MTLASKITFIRIAVIPVFVVSFLWNGERLENDAGKIVAFAMFLIGAISDYYDGVIARWYKEETRFGQFIDPLADKLLVLAALITMVEYKTITYIPSWAAIIIISREIAVNGLRMVCAPNGTIIEASLLGKWKTATQLLLIIASLGCVGFRVMLETYKWTETAGWFLPNYGKVISGLLSLTVFITIYSGYDYFKRNWHLLRD